MHFCFRCVATNLPATEALPPPGARPARRCDPRPLRLLFEACRSAGRDSLVGKASGCDCVSESCDNAPVGAGADDCAEHGVDCDGTLYVRGDLPAQQPPDTVIIELAITWRLDHRQHYHRHHNHSSPPMPPHLPSEEPVPVRKAVL